MKEKNTRRKRCCVSASPHTPFGSPVDQGINSAARCFYPQSEKIASGTAAHLQRFTFVGYAIEWLPTRQLECSITSISGRVRNTIERYWAVYILYDLSLSFLLWVFYQQQHCISTTLLYIDYSGLQLIVFPISPSFTLLCTVNQIWRRHWKLSKPPRKNNRKTGKRKKQKKKNKMKRRLPFVNETVGALAIKEEENSLISCRWQRITAGNCQVRFQLVGDASSYYTSVLNSTKNKKIKWFCIFCSVV